jgi:predicted ester cyclase
MKWIFFKMIIAGATIAWLTSCQNPSATHQHMVEFGENYTEAWNSGVPGNVADFYAEDGTLTINQGTPAIGRDQLSEVAHSFMEAFPDMLLTMDSLVREGDTYRYHWTFEGTHAGPEGTGNKVKFSGYEQWSMNDQGLVQTSIGTFDADDYQRQLDQ